MISRLPKLIRQHEIKTNRLLNQKRVAEESGVSRATINKLVKHPRVRRIDDETVTRLCYYFDCVLTDLVEVTFDDLPDELRERRITEG